jgi:hypothetical protein
VIDAEKATHSIIRMAELLGVSRSGFYAWAARRDAPPGPRAARAAELTVKIRDFHAASDQVNGAPRILADLRDSGEVVSKKTVAKLMRVNGIRGISPRPWQPVTTICDEGPHSIPDLVGRRFDQGRLNVVSPICAPGRDGCTWRPCVTAAHAGYSATASVTVCTPILSRPRCAARWRFAIPPPARPAG